MGSKQRCIKINLDNTFEELTLKRDGAIVKEGKNEIIIEPRNVYTEKKKGRLGFLKKARKIILFVENTRYALKFKEWNPPQPNKDGKIPESPNDLVPFWNMGEAQEFVDKKVTESLEKYKSMSWLQVLIVGAIGVVNLALLVKVIIALGGF